MMLISGLLLLLLLLQTAACLELNCSFDQSDPCYTALGHKLNLLMVQDASKYDLQLKKRINNNTADGPVCRVKNDRMRMSQCNLYNNRTDVTVINGILIINRVIRADSGNYRLTLFHSDGSETSRDLQVIVEEPTTAAVTSSLTSSVTSSLTSSLTSNVTSNVTSAVTNSSQASETVLLYMIAFGCVALILILLFITVCYVYKKKHRKSTPAAAGDTELIYTNIPKRKDEKKTTESLPAAEEEYASVRPQTKRKKKKVEEEEIQNGEVTFTPNHSVAPKQHQEECVYAQAQRR